MIEIKFKPDSDDLSEALYISPRRRTDLVLMMGGILQRFYDQAKTSIMESTDVIFKQFIDLAENHQELAYLSYCAGEKTVEMVNRLTNEDLDEMFEDDIDSED